MNGEYVRRIKRSLDHVGIRLGFSKNSRPIDFTYISDPNPLELAYRYGTRSALLKIPLARCRHMRLLAFPCIQESPSPFIQALMGMGGNTKVDQVCHSLQHLYENFQPTSAEDIIGIGHLSNRELAESHPAGAILPWLPSSVKDQIKIERRLMQDESRQHGESLGLNEGHIFFGPATKQKTLLERHRLILVFNSIKKYGYELDFSGYMNINVTCLWSGKNNDWRFLVQGGEHRISALVALGYTTAAVQTTRHGLTGIVQREHAAHWPAVRQGYFTEEEALKIFDRIFDGRQPPAYIAGTKKTILNARDADENCDSSCYIQP